MASNTDRAKFVNTNPKENTILAFTNGRGEPYAINVERSIDELDQIPSLNAISTDDTDQNDFKFACPRVHLLPISFEFDFDPQKSSGNFENADGFQFSYQVVYKNGSTSAIAPYSDVAYPPAIINLGLKTLAEVEVENRCVLFIPKVSAEAKFIRLIAREGNNSNPRVVDQFRVDVESDDFIITNDDFLGQYSFYNDKIGTLLSEIDATKTFDNVPRNAKAQTVADNRVMYGNYTEGYPNITTDVNLSVEFKQAPPPGFSFELKALPYVFRKKTDQASGDSGSTVLGRQRYKTNSGFVLDTSGFPENVPLGVYTVSVTVAPKNNYHVFLGTGDLANSRENAIAGPDGIAEDSFFGLGIQTDFSDFEGGQFAPQSRAIRGREMGAASQSSTNGLPVDGSLRASYFNGGYNTASSVSWDSSNGDLHLTDIGRSFSSPLVFKGEPVTFSTTIQVNSSTQRDTFSKAILHGLCGLHPNSSPMAANGSQVAPTSSPSNYFKEVSYDLGLIDDTSFSAEGSYLSDLVCSVSSGYNNPDVTGNMCSREPDGFFVINKATMRFCGEPARGYAGELENLLYQYAPNKSGYGMFMSFAHAKDVNVKTVIPTPEGKFASAASPTAAIQSGELFTNTNSGTDTELLRARRYFATGTGDWDWRLDSNGDPQITWPSCYRQWETPDGALNGPSRIQNTDPNNLQTFIDTAVIDQGTVFLSSDQPDPMIAPVLPTRQYDDGKVRESNDSFRNTLYHPAPIKNWIIVGDENSDVLPSEKPNSYWNNIYGGAGFSVNIDVPQGTQPASDFFVQGDPSVMLGDISRHYCGYLKNYNNAGFFQFGRDIEYSAPSDLVSVSNYLDRGTLSLVDGEMGPGGMNGIGAAQFGNRDDSNTFGLPLVMGTHDISGDESVNTMGSMGNIRGTVTNFGLLGYMDNCAGFVVNEIIARTPETISSDYATSFDEGATFGNCQLAQSFAVVFPKYADAGQDWGDLGVNTVPFYRSPLTSGYFSSFYSSPGSQITAFDTRVTSEMAGTIAQSQYNRLIQPVQTKQPPSGSAGSAVVVSGASINTSSEELGYNSFKTKANHEFGIVYYDERGRHGAVQPVGSVYVPGYDTEDRGSSLKGSAKVKMEINHAPPSWAKNYRVVYSGNTSISEFIQHTVADAFVSSKAPGRIYVSLNHLQSNKISYAESYGAVSLDDGTKSLYRFNQGDRLRIINYSNISAQLEYAPKEYDFRIVDLEIVGPDMDNHPFPDNSDQARFNGEFLVLEDNKEAEGFSVENVQGAGVSSFWGNRCLVEIYRPAKGLGDESRAYYELNYGGEVLPGPTHQFNTIVMTRGDVFYRSVPMNVQTLDLNLATETTIGEYSSLIQGSADNESSVPNLVSYYVETEAITDLYKSDAKSYGRVHFVDRFADEVDRPSSISFSEKTFQGSYDLRYFSFPKIGNFKDLPRYSGGIDVMDFQGTNIMSFNDSKVYYIPVSRDVLTTGTTDAIVASTKVLGSEIAIPIDGGSSKRPESVISINNDFFFFDERNERIVMIKGGKNPVIITDANVDSYFQSEVQKWKQSGAFKAPSGYDPMRSEYLISLSSLEDAYTYHDHTSARDRMLTMGFDLKTKKFWKSRYSFAPHFYSTFNGKLVSYHSDKSLIHQNTGGDDIESPFVVPQIHNDTSRRNKIYGKKVRSSLCVSANANNSKTKEFNVVVLDSDNRWEANLYTPTGASAIPFSRFKGYNDKYYGKIVGNTTVAAEQRKSQITKRTIQTMPYAFDERLIPSTGQLLQSQFLGPRGFAFVNENGELYTGSDANGIKYMEFQVVMSKSSSAFTAPLAIGKNSILYESLPGGSQMVPLGSGPQNTHSFNRKAFIAADTEDTNRTRKLVIRAPWNQVENYCLQNGHEDVVERVTTDEFTSEPSPVFGFFSSVNNDETGYKVFDIIFAPYYSMFFGKSVQQDASLNNLISLFDGEGIFSGGDQTQYAWDLNEDGNVSTADLLEFLTAFGNPFGSDELLDILAEFGSGEDDESTVDFDTIGSFTAEQFVNLYNGERKEIHSVYTNQLNAPELTGRYMKIDLVSDDAQDDAQLYEIMVDHDNRVKSLSRTTKGKKK